MNKNEILDAYLFLREHNHSIPSETLEFMKDVALRELKKIESGSECFSCQHDGFQAIHPSACTGCGDTRNFKLKV